MARLKVGVFLSTELNCYGELAPTKASQVFNSEHEALSREEQMSSFNIYLCVLVGLSVFCMGLHAMLLSCQVLYYFDTLSSFLFSLSVVLKFFSCSSVFPLE